MCSDKSIVYKSKTSGSGKINDMEFEAIQTAVRMFSKNIVLYSDNLPAIHRAKKIFTGMEIRHVNGKDNPAHKVLCGCWMTKKKKEEIEEKVIKKTVREINEISYRKPNYMNVMTPEGERIMSQSKFRKYVRFMQKKFYLRKEEQKF